MQNSGSRRRNLRKKRNLRKPNETIGIPRGASRECHHKHHKDMENNELYQLRICLDGKVDYLGTLFNENKLHINKANVTELTFNSVEGHRLHAERMFYPRSSKPKSLLIYSGNRIVCTKENDEYRLHEHKGNGARLTFETFVEQRRYKGLMFDFRQREVEFTRIYFRDWLNLLVTCDRGFTDLSFGDLGYGVGYIEVVSDTRSREIETIRVRFDGERECLLTSEGLITLAHYITTPHSVNVSFGDEVYIKLKFNSQWRVHETFEFRKPRYEP